MGVALEHFSALLTPTMECLFVEQFHRFKCGDRFWHTTSLNSPYPFTVDQLKSIMDHTISSIFCANSNISEVPEIGFVIPSEINRIIDCIKFKGLDLKLWKE